VPPDSGRFTDLCMHQQAGASVMFTSSIDMSVSLPPVPRPSLVLSDIVIPVRRCREWPEGDLGMGATTIRTASRSRPHFR
jgi:hypothetical protein